MFVNWKMPTTTKAGKLERQHDLPEDLDQPGAVDPRRLDQLVRHIREVVAEDQRRDRDAVDDVDDRQALPLAVEPDLV